MTPIWAHWTLVLTVPLLVLSCPIHDMVQSLTDCVTHLILWRVQACEQVNVAERDMCNSRVDLYGNPPASLLCCPRGRLFFGRALGTFLETPFPHGQSILGRCSKFTAGPFLVKCSLVALKVSCAALATGSIVIFFSEAVPFILTDIQLLIEPSYLM